MNYPSPRTPGSTPIHEWEYSRMSSATPTPSPRHSWFESTPRRPATRAAHSRATSYSQQASFSPRLSRDSPRYNSSGEYATVDVSDYDFPSPRRPSGRSPESPLRRDRCHSYSYVRASTPYGESDEDEIIETLGGIYVLPAQSRAKDKRRFFFSRGHSEGARYTNLDECKQSSPYYYPYDYDYPAYNKEPPPHESPRPRPPPQTRPPTSQAHTRRASTSVPQRPATARPTATHSAKATPLTPQKATDLHAKLHKIPPGYSLKNWDPNEQPILLLGSVFDSNSLGKWIYDWTVYREGPVAPKSDIAGELWLLLIQLAAKVKRAEEIIVRVRSVENRELMNDFLESGARLMDKLRSLLKACEAPMLKVAKKKQTGLGKNSGVEFVDTLFGVEREGPKTDKLMQGIRLFNLRFDANCENILQNPTI